MADEEDRPLSIPYCDENTFRYLFSTSAQFIGQAHGEYFTIQHSFPHFGSNERRSYIQNGPNYRCHFVLSVNTIQNRTGGKNFAILETYHWLGDIAAPLFSILFGKFFQHHGQIQSGAQLTLPDSTRSPIVAWEKSPFDSKPRQPSGPELNFGVLSRFLPSILYVESKEKDMLTSAATFYQLALENWSIRPELAYTSLISAIEAVLDFKEYTDSELFDNQRLNDFRAIRTLEDGNAIEKRLRSSLYSVRRKFVHFVEEHLANEYFHTRECNSVAACLDKEDLRSALNASYDLRSRYLHTGDNKGLWTISQEGFLNAEKAVGNPVFGDRKLKRLLKSALTLSGLERVVSMVLRKLAFETFDFGRTS